MVLDLQASLLGYIYTTLTTDATLQTACGGTVRLYPDRAIPDATFPYIVQRIDITMIDDFFPMRRGVLIIDIWSNSPNKTELTGIRKVLVELIDELDFSTTEVSHCRVSLEDEGDVPDEDENIYHYVLQFGLRLYRKYETANIIGR